MIRVSPTSGAMDAACSDGSSAAADEELSDVQVRQLFDSIKESPGSKLQAVLTKLKEVLEQDPAAKLLVFTAFERTRARIVTMLQREKIKCIHVAAGMEPGKKAAQLNQFSSDPECTVLLLDMR